MQGTAAVGETDDGSSTTAGLLLGASVTEADHRATAAAAAALAQLHPYAGHTAAAPDAGLSSFEVKSDEEERPGPPQQELLPQHSYNCYDLGLLSFLTSPKSGQIEDDGKLALSGLGFISDEYAADMMGFKVAAHQQRQQHTSEVSVHSSIPSTAVAPATDDCGVMSSSSSSAAHTATPQPQPHTELSSSFFASFCDMSNPYALLYGSQTPLSTEQQQQLQSHYSPGSETYGNADLLNSVAASATSSYGGRDHSSAQQSSSDGGLLDSVASQKAVAFQAGPKERIVVAGRTLSHCPRCTSEGLPTIEWKPQTFPAESRTRYMCSRMCQDIDSNHHYDVPLCPLCNTRLLLYEFNFLLGLSNARRMHKYALKCENQHVLPMLDLYCQTKKGGDRCNANFKLQWCYGTMVKRCEAQKNRDHDLWWVRYKNEWKQRRTIIRYKKDFLSHLSDSQRSLLLGLGNEGEAPPDPKTVLGPGMYDSLVASAAAGCHAINGVAKVKKRGFSGRGGDDNCILNPHASTAAFKRLKVRNSEVVATPALPSLIKMDPSEYSSTRRGRLACDGSVVYHGEEEQCSAFVCPQTPAMRRNRRIIIGTPSTALRTPVHKTECVAFSVRGVPVGSAESRRLMSLTTNGGGVPDDESPVVCLLDTTTSNLADDQKSVYHHPPQARRSTLSSSETHEAESVSSMAIESSSSGASMLDYFDTEKYLFSPQTDFSLFATSNGSSGRSSSSHESLYSADLGPNALGALELSLKQQFDEEPCEQETLESEQETLESVISGKPLDHLFTARAQLDVESHTSQSVVTWR